MEYNYRSGNLDEFIAYAKQPRKISIDELSVSPLSPFSQFSPMDDTEKKLRKYSEVSDSEVNSPIKYEEMNDDRYDADKLDTFLYLDRLTDLLLDYVKGNKLSEFLDLLSVKGNMLKWKPVFDYIYKTDNFTFFEAMKFIPCVQREFFDSDEFKTKCKHMNHKKKFI